MSYYAGEIVRLRDDFFRKFRDKAFFEAAAAGEEIVGLYKKNNDEASMEYAIDLNNLAIAYDEAGNFKRAIELYEKAAEIKKLSAGEDSESYADTLNNLGVAFSRINKHSAAVENHKKAYRIRRKILGPEHTDTVFSLFNMGNAYEDMKNYSKALLYHRKALEGAEKNVSIPKADLSDIYAAYGNSLTRSGEFKKGINYLLKSMELVKQVSGENNFDYISIVLNAAKAYEKIECFKESKIYFEKAIDLRSRIMDKKHFDYVTTLNMYCGVLEKLGEYEKILKIQKDCQKLIEEITSKNHVLYGDSLLKEARTYLNMGRLDAAEASANSALEIKRNSMKAELEVGYVDCYMLLGRIYDKKGDFDKAVEYQKKALDIKVKALGSKGVFKANSLVEIGKVYLHKKDFIKAVDCFEKAMGAVISGVGSAEKSYMNILFKIAEAYFESGDRKKALETADTAYEASEKRFSYDNAFSARYLYRKALMEFKCGKKELASQNMIDALNIQKEKVGEDTSVFDETQKSLADIYMSMGLYSDALKIFDALCAKGAGNSKKDQLQFAEMKFSIALAREKMGSDDMCMIAYNLAVMTFEKFNLRDEEKYFQLILNYSRFMQNKGLFKEAAILLERVVFLSEAEINNYSGYMADIYKNLGDIYREDEPQKAVDFYRKRFEVIRDDGEFTSVEIANAAIKVSDLLVDLERFPEALKLSMEALSIIEADLGTGIEYAKILLHSAEQYKKWGKIEDAVLIMSRAGDILALNLGSESDEYIKLLTQKGILCYQNNLFDKALGDLEKVYNFHIKSGKKISDPMISDALKAIYSDRKEFIKLAKIKMGKEI